MRLLGFVGLFPLGLLNIFGFVRAVQDRDLKGVVLMLFMTALLTFFAFTLWQGAKYERSSAQGRLADGWDGEPVSAFFAGVVARSLEGRIYIAGAVASSVAALLALVWPEAIGLAPAKAPNDAVLFGLWPIVGFVVYVRVCGPTYQTGIVTILLTVASAVVPFYIAYV